MTEKNEKERKKEKHSDRLAKATEGSAMIKGNLETGYRVQGGSYRRSMQWALWLTTCAVLPYGIDIRETAPLVPFRVALV